LIEVLPVLRETAASPQSREGSLDDPSLRQYDELFRDVAAFDDLDVIDLSNVI